MAKRNELEVLQEVAVLLEAAIDYEAPREDIVEAAQE